MKAFCMDVHISVIADFKSANPDINVTDWCLSGHHWVMNRRQDSPEYINAQTWKHLNMGMIQSFQDKYDSFLSQFDMFIVCHCASFAMIYEKYNKPILMINSCRYDLPFCFTKDFEMLTHWHTCLERLNKKGLLTIVSNNRADQEYTRIGTGINPLYLPSLCLYTNTQYRPTKTTFLCYSGSTISHPLITQKAELGDGYSWNEIASYRGIIHFPYEVSTMSMFEQYTAGCPLFFPSKQFWKSIQSIQSTSAYWGNDIPIWLKSFRNPETWIELSDIYTLFSSPNTYYFDSIEDLYKLLETFQYREDSRTDYIARVQQGWKFILSSFWTKYPRHLCYNRLPLLANVVYDVNYNGSGVTAQHTYPFHTPLRSGDVVFVKTDLLTSFLKTTSINVPIALITGVSDISPTPEQGRQIVENPNITAWIGCNIEMHHPKIRKIPIGVGEPERVNGNHETLERLHNSRLPWNEKLESICIPYCGNTHSSRVHQSTLPKLAFEDYMREISKHKFVVCPRGNGIDTHRVCETLLMGSVPVLEHSGLDDMYVRFPCILVDSFDSIDTSTFVWDESKYQTFLDTFWLRDGFKRYIKNDC